MKCEIGLQKSVLHSSFLLPTFPVFANPPFNDSDWFRKDDDVRWQFGVPKRNANFAWVQHFKVKYASRGNSQGATGRVKAKPISGRAL